MYAIARVARKLRVLNRPRGGDRVGILGRCPTTDFMAGFRMSPPVNAEGVFKP